MCAFAGTYLPAAAAPQPESEVAAPLL